MNRCLFLFCIFSLPTLAQKPKKPLFNEIGIISGFGVGISKASIPEGDYRPIYGIIHLGKSILKDTTHPFFKKSTLTYYQEPQFNLVQIVGLDNTKTEFEFGLNMGFKFTYPLIKPISIFVSGGTGVHYFSAKTYRQYPGFLFSNNFGTGFQVEFHKRWIVLLGFRFRHMSNLNILMPNHGINNYNIHVGFLYSL